MAETPRGCFIVLEGIDGSGTTLQTRALADRLRERGREVLETREPTSGAIGALIRERLSVRAAALDPAALALLFAADRLDHLTREVIPAVAAGKVVISDRYLLSSLAYQSLDCDPAWIREINARAARPDLTLVLEVPAEVAFDRVQRRMAQGAAVEERFDALALQRRIAEHYRRFRDDPGLGPVRVIDGTTSPTQVTEALIAAVHAVHAVHAVMDAVSL
ncbi:MAG TPA: dTMP kinase [Nannocystis sp.]|jgi:dTMP kinase